MLSDGKIIPLPPVVLGKLGKDPNTTTICIYGHVDVQPARIEDGWTTDPYVLTEKDGNLYGRGCSDDKGPILAWLHAIEAFQKLKQELPVNVNFIFEGMEQSGSSGLRKLRKMRPFFSSVEFIVMSDSSWLSKEPVLSYGTRGLCYFNMEVEGANQDLHSGSYGRTVHEAMTDLIALLDSLVNSSGHILIPGIDSDVVPLTDEERLLYEPIEFNLEAFKHSIGTTELLHKTKVKTYLNGVFAERRSPNELRVTLQSGSKAWLADVTDKQYNAGQRAIRKIFGIEADLIRAGGTIPIARTFQHTMQKSVLMLPIGGTDDGIHSQNEKLSRENYINGTKLFAAFMIEISQL